MFILEKGNKKKKKEDGGVCVCDDSSGCHNYLPGAYKEDGVKLFLQAHIKRSRGNLCNTSRSILAGYKKKKKCTGQILKQVTQRGCGSSLFGEIKNLGNFELPD